MISIATAALTLMAGPVTAQEGDDAVQEAELSPPQKPKSRLKIEEIVVTARKKEESLQEVPMAITAFSAEGLDRAGIDNLADVAAFTPGLTFSSLFGEFLPVPVIRGVAPTAIFGENNVAVFIDGVFVAGREGLNSSQLDLERIEVLKGPQSTKYGRNAFAGAINYVSARPGDELEGEAKVNVGNYDKRQARITVGGPLIPDLLTGRIAFGVDEWSGTYNNALSNLDIGGYQYKTLQTSLWLTPSDTLDMQWSLYLSDDEIDDSARTTVAANCEDRQWLENGYPVGHPLYNGGQPIAPSPVADPLNPGETRDNPDYSDGPRPQNFCGTIPSLRDNTLAINDESTGEERELVRSSFHLDWDTGWGSIVALTGFSKTNQKARSDSNQMPPGTLHPDGTVRPAGTVPFYYATAGGGADVFDAELTTAGTGDETNEWSQELRYSTPLDRSVRFDIGGYWYNVKAEFGNTDFTGRMTGGSGERLPADFAGFFPGAGVIGDAIFGPRFQNSVDSIVPPGEVPDGFADETSSWSGFAGLEMDLGDQWTVDVGVRYTNDKQTFKAELHGDDEDGNPTTEIINETRRFDYWTGRAGARFQVTDDNMIYTSLSNGKKSGGMDLLFGDLLMPNDQGGIDVVPITRVTDFDIEELTALELGNKGTIWDGRAQYDIALFYNDWKDILMPQILDTDPETGLPLEQPEGVDLTGGDATTYGVEVSLNVILADNWNVNLGGSWTKAEYDDAELAGLRLFPRYWNDTTGPEGVPDGVGDPGDISGNELLRQSEWQGFFTLNYTRPLRGEWEFYSRSDVLYTGSQWVGPANEAEVPATTVVNQRLGFETEAFRLEFWIENLLDQNNPTAAFRDVTFNNTHLDIPAYGGFSDMFPFRMTISNPRLRTYGVSALMRF